MSTYRFMARLFLTFAVLGLILAPLARPVMAMTTDMSGMNQSMQVAAGPALADMDCCPPNAMHGDAGKIKADGDADKAPCGKDCPMMSMCMASAVNVISPSHSLSIFLTAATVTYSQVHRDLAGLVRAPAPRPPTI
jgi:hypothetical protein